MTASHAAIQAPSSEPCPLCGCGTALAAHKPARKARRLRVMEDRTGYPTLFRDHPRSAFQPGNGAEGRAIIASWQAHRDAGEYPVLVDARRGTVEWRKAA